MNDGDWEMRACVGENGGHWVSVCKEYSVLEVRASGACSLVCVPHECEGKCSRDKVEVCVFFFLKY